MFHEVGLVDRREFTRMQAHGADFLPLLGRLSTGAVATLAEGELRPTVLTSPMGRIVALLLLWRSPEGVRLISGAALDRSICDHIGRFRFAEKFELKSTGETTFHLALIGPAIGSLLERLALTRPAAWSASRQSLAGVSIDLLGHDGDSPMGLSLIGSRGDAEVVRRTLAHAVEELGGCVVGEEALQLRRILQGLPASGHELTDKFNPLEAGLDHAVSFTKGCYVGQEVIARLHSYKKVSRRIVGLDFGSPTRPPECGASLAQDDRPCGVVTSRAQLLDSNRWIGMGYVKLKALDSATPITVSDGSTVEIVALPFPASVRAELRV